MGAIVGGTWTYSGDPSVDDKDLVRFLVGDTDGANQLVSDEEILASLANEGHPYKAAANVALSIAGFYARSGTGSKQVGDLKVSASLAQGYRDLAKDLRGQAAVLLTRGAAPYDAALTKSEVADTLDDNDRSTPQFTIGSGDSPLVTP